MSETYRAVVENANSKGVWVTVPSLGGASYGPLEVLSYSRDATGDYETGDKVLIQQVGKVADDFMVIGLVQRWDPATEDTVPAHNHAAGDVNSGTFDLLRIPDLPADKTTSGEFDPLRIPGLDAAKIVSGEFHLDRIPDLPASQTTSGTFADARIPTLDASKIGTGRFTNDRMPALSSLAAGVDLNTLVTPGVFVQGTAAQGTMALNYPFDNAAGMIEVFQHDVTSDVIYQRFAARDSLRVFTRVLNGGVWTTWIEYLSKFNVTGPDITSGTISDARLSAGVQSLRAPVSIPGSADLNTYSTPGLYHQNSNANAATGTNYPVAVAGLLEVFFMDNGSSDFIYQRYTNFSTTDTQGTYMRMKYSANAWTAWEQMATKRYVDQFSVPQVWTGQNLNALPAGIWSVLESGYFGVGSEYGETNPGGGTLALNFPEDSFWGYIEVFDDPRGVPTYQRATSNTTDQVWHRTMRFDEGDWTDWHTSGVARGGWYSASATALQSVTSTTFAPLPTPVAVTTPTLPTGTIFLAWVNGLVGSGSSYTIAGVGELAYKLTGAVTFTPDESSAAVAGYNTPFGNGGGSLIRPFITTSQSWVRIEALGKTRDSNTGVRDVEVFILPLRTEM